MSDKEQKSSWFHVDETQEAQSADSHACTVTRRSASRCTAAADTGLRLGFFGDRTVGR
jgi:hypothetical protein